MEEDFRSPSDKPQQIAEPHKKGPQGLRTLEAQPQGEKPCLSPLGGQHVTKGPSHLRQLCVNSVEAFLIFPRVECCASGTTLNSLRLALGSVAPPPPSPSAPRAWGHGSRYFLLKLAMKIERLASHNEAREALVLSVASVTAIMLTAYLLLLILY